MIVTVPARAPISILGCLADYAWCDTIFEGSRGWMRSIYLSGYYQGYYYSLRDYAPRLGYRTVSFDINGYWNSNYRDRSFYGERSRWTAPREEGYVDTACVLRSLVALWRLDLAAGAICLGTIARRSVLAPLHTGSLYSTPTVAGRGSPTNHSAGPRTITVAGASPTKSDGFLGPGSSLGACMGVLALFGRLSRLGAAAAGP